MPTLTSSLALTAATTPALTIAPDAGLTPADRRLCRTLCEQMDTIRDEGRTAELADHLDLMASVAVRLALGTDWTALTNL